MNADRPTIHVLLVEDEVDAARLVTRRLTYYPAVHFEVTHVPDLSTAFARIEEQSFDVMVLDPSSSEFFKAFRGGGSGAAAPARK